LPNRERGLQPFYESLTSEKAKTALAEQTAASPGFVKSLNWPETGSEEVVVGEEVLYDEVDSSRTVEVEVGALILREPSHIIGDWESRPVDDNDDDVHIIGPFMGKYTGCDFSSCTATNEWMEWDVASNV
jgi:hypothetical protein